MAGELTEEELKEELYKTLRMNDVNRFQLLIDKVRKGNEQKPDITNCAFFKAVFLIYFFRYPAIQTIFQFTSSGQTYVTPVRVSNESYYSLKLFFFLNSITILIMCNVVVAICSQKRLWRLCL